MGKYMGSHAAPCLTCWRGVLLLLAATLLVHAADGLSSRASADWCGTLLQL
jgi:hypothetical protein